MLESSWPMNTKKCTGHSKALMSQKVRWCLGWKKVAEVTVNFDLQRKEKKAEQNNARL